LASLAQRTGRLSAAFKPSRKGWSVIQTELEPLIKPVVGLIESGMSTPTVPWQPVSRSIARTMPVVASTVAE